LKKLFTFTVFHVDVSVLLTWTSSKKRRVFTTFEIFGKDQLGKHCLWCSFL